MMNQLIPANKAELTYEQLPALNPRQSLMLTYLMQGYNHTESYRKAGYESDIHAGKAAFVLINKSPLKDHLEWFRKEQARICTKEWKTARLMEIVNESLCKSDEQQVIGINGEIAIKAIQELNKMQGDYAVQQIQVNSIHASIEDVRNARMEYKKDQ